MAGYLAKSAAFSASGEEAVAGALKKVIAKKTGKKVTSKAGKFAVSRAAEAIASAPVNAEDAAKNSKDAKEFGKNMAVNAALDAGPGSATDGARIAVRASKSAKLKTIRNAVQKTEKGEELTKKETGAKAKALRSAIRKTAKGRQLTESEAEVLSSVKKRAEQKKRAAQAAAEKKPSVKAVRPDRTLTQAETKTVRTLRTKSETTRHMSVLAEAKDAADRSGHTPDEAAEMIRQAAKQTFDDEAAKLADDVCRYKSLFKISTCMDLESRIFVLQGKKLLEDWRSFKIF